MTTKINFRNLSLFLLLMLPFSCTKKEYELSLQESQNIALKQIKEIVGEKGEIKLTSQPDYKKVLDSKENSTKIRVNKLSLNQFREVFKEMGIAIKYEAKRSTLVLDSSLISSSKIKTDSIKSFGFVDIDAGPGPAGYHHVQFKSGSPLNQDKGGWYTMHLNYNTNSYGQVIGQPTISFSGIGFFSWQQVNMSNINFNPSNYSSNFIITGINTYGIQIGGVTIGWSAYAKFDISINMDELSSMEAMIIERKLN